MNGKNGGVYIKRLIEDGALKEDFKTELLGIFPLKECLDRETELAKTSLFPKGLNGNAGSHIEMTEEVREKISATKTGKSHTPETRSKISLNNGSRNPQTRAKMSVSRTGKPKSPEARAKISAANIGRTKSPETRAKIGNAHRGKIVSLEQCAKISAAMTGKPRSSEARAKISAANTGMINALNIETNEVKRIPTDLYHSRRDIYFSTKSKVYREWKQQKSKQGTSNEL